MLDALRIRRLAVPGVEADDVIATLATLAADNGVDVVIVTGDRDAFQLVRDPHIKVLYNKRGVSDYARYDEAGIVERTGGVTPQQYIDYAAFRGDSSDNLPGRAGHRREDRGQADHHLRAPRRHLRAPRRAPAEAAREPRRRRANACSRTAR